MNPKMVSEEYRSIYTDFKRGILFKIPNKINKYIHTLNTMQIALLNDTTINE